MRSILLLFVFWLIFFVPVSSRAAVVLPAFISNGMVLQQHTNAMLRGKATPGALVRIQPSWENKFFTVKANADSTWKIEVRTPAGGKKKHTIRISDGEELVLKNVLIGEVWLASGQSNMEMPLKGFPNNQPVKDSDTTIAQSLNPYIRFFNVPNRAWARPLNDCKGRWLAASPVNTPNFSATAYFFAKALFDKLDVPIGVLEADYGGTDIRAWMSLEALQAFPEIRLKNPADSSFKNRNEPAGLFNGMIAPIVGYSIKGVIWYQGEHNRTEPEAYSKLLPAMIHQWRMDWKCGDFPFYYVQIAPHLYKGNAPVALQKMAPSIPRFREMQQRIAATIPNTGVAVLTDAGSASTVHPPDKEKVGLRLSGLALAKIYGFQEIAYSGPVYSSFSVKKDKLILRFDHARGLYLRNGTTGLFEVAGKNGLYYPATVRIEGETIELHAKEVKVPVAARYAYKAWVDGDLFNGDHLPASTFSTTYPQ